MSRTISLVQRVQIASPCNAPWDEMVGDDTSRFCSHCKLNVYNLSKLTEAEGEQLIIAKEGKLCARIYRRFDGTVLTKDCPVGLKALRRRVMWTSMRAAAALVFIAAATATAIGMRTQPRGDSAIITILGPGWGDSTVYQRAVASMRRWLATSPPVQTGFMMGDFAPLPTSAISTPAAP